MYNVLYYKYIRYHDLGQLLIDSLDVLAKNFESFKYS